MRSEEQRASFSNIIEGIAVGNFYPEILQQVDSF